VAGGCNPALCLIPLPRATPSYEPPSRKTVYQATALPVLPGIVSRPTPTPPVGNLHELFPETFGGVSYLPFVHVRYVPSIFANKDCVHVKYCWFQFGLNKV